MNPRFSLAALLLASCGASPPDISVTHAWARSTVAGQSSAAAYLTLANAGGSPDRLVAVSSTTARASLHEASSAGGIARMRPLAKGLEIPAGGSVSLEPGGNHIMLTDLRAPLRPGSRLRVRLDFARSPDREIEIHILDAAAGGGGAHTHHSE